jgi:hypothetical protein
MVSDLFLITVCRKHPYLIIQLFVHQNFIITVHKIKTFFCLGYKPTEEDISVKTDLKFYFDNEAQVRTKWEKGFELRRHEFEKVCGGDLKRIFTEWPAIKTPIGLSLVSQMFFCL